MIPNQDEKASPHRKVYAKGFYDGVAAAGGDVNMSMSQMKFKSTWDSLTSQQRKIYDAVPAMDEWSPSTIAEALRRTGSVGSTDQLKGNLNYLVDMGLILEPRRGMFIRKHVKDTKPQPSLAIVPSVESKPIVETKEESMPEEAPIDKLACLSSRLRKAGKEMATLADDIDAAALDISDKIASSSEETQKLKQLQKLLKELG